MSDFEIIEQLYQGHYCSNCFMNDSCKENRELGTCLKWQKQISLTPNGMLNIVRQTFPNTIKGEIFKEFSMAKSTDNISYLTIIENQEKYLKSINEENNETT